MSAAGTQYNVKLQRMVKEVKRDVDALVLPMLKQYAPEYVADATPTFDGWADAVQRLLGILIGRWSSPVVRDAANVIAGEFVRAAVKTDERQRKSFGIDVFSGSEQMQEYVSAATFQNAQLITSIPAQYLDQVGNIVLTNMRAGMRPSYIEQALQDQFGVTKRRAKMIARDQTAKVQGDIAEKRQRAAGFEYFQWVTSGDERVRERHSEIADKVTPYGRGIYRWDDLPLSSKGEPIKPGQDFSCRCISKPILAQQVERNQKEGKTSKK